EGEYPAVPKGSPRDQGFRFFLAGLLFEEVYVIVEIFRALVPRHDVAEIFRGKLRRYAEQRQLGFGIPKRRLHAYHSLKKRRPHIGVYRHYGNRFVQRNAFHGIKIGGGKRDRGERIPSLGLDDNRRVASQLALNHFDLRSSRRDVPVVVKSGLL